MQENETSVLTIAEQAALVRGRDARATELLELAHARCNEFNEPLNAFVYLDWDGAARTAAEIDAALARGEDPGPLAGVPFGVKDLHDCAGMPTRYGSLLHIHAPPAADDAPAVARLRAAGAVPIGKTATAEWGMDSATATRAFGVTRNPWNLALTPGGSSGGSAAAVSAGIVPFATGTDEGGSIRSPASFCGLVGLKPTHGRVPRENGISDASVTGVLTRTALDTALVLDAIGAGDPRDKTSMTGRSPLLLAPLTAAVDVTGLRATWSDDLGYATVDPEVASVARAAAQRLVEGSDLTMVNVSLAFTDPALAWMPIVATRLLRRLQAVGALPSGAGELCKPTAEFVEYATSIDGATLGRAEQLRIVVEREVADVFERTDLLLTPTVACEPFAAEGPPPTTIAGREVGLGGVEPFTMLANLAWLPAISIFAGVTARGLPVGIQICARWGWDGTLLRLAHLAEQIIPRAGTRHR